LDFYHFLKPSLANDWHSSGRLFATDTPDENYRVFKILKSTSDRLGPGLIYTDFLLLSRNHTLYVGTYPFNAVSNVRLDPSKAQWAGILANINYQPFLAKRFPLARWYWPASDLNMENGGLLVGIIPMTALTRPTFNRWLKADQYFHQLNVEAENALTNKTIFLGAIQRLPEGEGWVRGDPFLEACFGEWKAQYQYGSSFAENAEAIQEAISRGYPAAHLYFELGNYLWKDHRYQEALGAFQKACRQRPNYTQAASAIQTLSRSIHLN
jgi:tetratricopeptide (TPR) repeat protein